MNCDGTALMGTDFRNNEYGLYYFENAFSGQQPEIPASQPRHGNRWLGSWGTGTNGAVYEGAQQIDLIANGYTVPSATGIEYAPNQDPAPGTFAIDWFDDDPGNSVQCINTCNIFEEQSPEGTTIRDQSVADGTYSPLSYAPVTIWLAEKQLYRKLRANPNLMPTGSIFESFYLGKSSSALEQLVLIEEDIQTLFDLDAGSENQLDSLNLSIAEKMERAVELSGEIAGANSTELPALLAEKEQVIDELNNYTDSKMDLLDTVQQSRNIVTDQVIADNAAIQTSAIQEQNEITVNDIFLRTFAKGMPDLDSIQVAALEAIGLQCPYEGGTAVFKARGLVATFSDIDFDALENCNSGSQGLVSSGGEEKIVPSISFSVFPNPASGVFNVLLTEPIGDNTELWVTDIYGRQLASHPLANGQQFFEFSSKDLANGTYFLKLVEDKKILSSDRLVIIK